MMTDSPVSLRLHQLLAPRQGAVLRTVLEAGLGCGLLMVLAHWVLHADTIAANLGIFLSVLWIIVWPAWRLRPLIRRRWWSAACIGTLRAVAVGAVLVAIATVFTLILQHKVPNWSAQVFILPSFLLARSGVVFGSVVARRVRRRYRWQLLVSHMGIIVLMFIGLTSVGSILGLAILTRFIASHPVAMAASVRDELQLARAVSPLEPRRVDHVFRLIYARRLPLRGESPIISFVSAPPLPTALGLVTPRGSTIAGRINLAQDGKKTRPALSWNDLVHLSSARGDRLRRVALSGRAGRDQVQRPDQSETIVVLPVRGPHRAISALLVLRVGDTLPTRQQFFRVVLTIFGVTTIALIVITFFPMLALSFVFSYLVARGLTRRLEALSGVATSIASGNLGQRAPITTRNEVGRLAQDVNRMADHLQTTMGELVGARAESEEALRLRQELVANISHELRTPLATMRAHLEMVTAGDAVPAGLIPGDASREVSVAASTLEALRAETERLEALVEDLFALSRAQAGAIEMQLQPVDVSALVEEIVALMRPLAQRAGRIVLSAEILHRPLWARADPTRLQQILANLVRNAVRHTPDGGIIVVSVSREAEWVLISVADTGEGIAAEHLPQIFERFYRADPARSRATGGAGLGLAIVQEFVELMGGRVEVESTPGEGTRFHVFLPATPYLE